MEFLRMLMEMGAAKLCDKCGKTMAANHYWYKGAWKCKGAGREQQPTNATTAPEQSPTEQLPTPETPNVQQKTTLGSTPIQPKPEAAAPATPIVTQPLVIEMDVIEEAMPLLEEQLKKINKVAKRIGAREIQVEVLEMKWKDVVRRIPDDSGFGGDKVEQYKQKVLRVRMTGTTPRIQGADGTMWSFVGVITPSLQGRAILRLTPGTDDNQTLRQLHSANPYYCDYCKKIRQRNETFIVSNGTSYRQVGRNCLKDFVGGADPQAVLQFFAFFNDKDHLMDMLYGSSGSSGDDEGGSGGGMRGTRYYTPERLLALTVATIAVRGGYVSAKVENGRSTASDVRFALWGEFYKGMPQSEIDAAKAIATQSEQPATIEKAREIIEWFKTLPASTIESNTFYQNVKVMIDENAVGEKQIGYIVGLYPAYQRESQQNTERASGPRLVKEWPEEWGAGPKEIVDEQATVKYVRNLVGTYGTSQLVFMMLDNGYGVTWKYSGKHRIAEGDVFTLTGELQKDEYRTPATIKFVPSRKWLRSAFND